jgi:hypothetical protein
MEMGRPESFLIRLTNVVSRIGMNSIRIGMASTETRWPDRGPTIIPEASVVSPARRNPIKRLPESPMKIEAG